jgi:uncharacterized membrane protein
MNLLSKFILALVLLLYLSLGISHSSHQGFWHDEIYTLTFLKGVSVYNFEDSVWSGQDSIYDVDQFKHLLAEDNFYSNFSTQILHEGHPPLYFFLLKLWSYGFGFSEIALRSFSLCCGLLVFLVLFNLFRRRSERKYTPWVVLAMLIFNPFLFYFFTEARMYALAILLATLSFRYWLEYQEQRKLKSYVFLYFCLSSIGLLYTHYFGLFFLSTLAFFELLKVGFKRSIFNHSIAVLCFLPWGIAIRKQLDFHDVHWTDGTISSGDSLIGYFDGIIHLLISPMVDPLFYERVVAIVIILLAIAFLLVKEWKFTLNFLSAIFIYGLQVYVFDQLVGHHSILVPRYYVFVLIFVYWGLYKMIDSSQNRVFSLLVPLTYALITSTILFQLYRLDRAPKQMYREVAGFVDGQVDPKTKVLIFEPKGPLMVGVAYYLQNNFKLILANKAPNNLETSAVYIDEMLGVAYSENKYHRKQQEKLEFIPFVGVFLYK